MVLIHPFYPENVGAAARAMAACGITDLVTVGGVTLDHPQALKLAVGGAEVLGRARTVSSLDEALEGIELSVATTGRPYEGSRPMLPRDAAGLAVRQSGAVALVFGNEKNGLSVRELMRCQQIVHIPVGSLNLAQAVMVMAYEWAIADHVPSDRTALVRDPELRAASKRLVDALAEVGFLKPHQAPRRLAQISRLLSRCEVDAEELSTLQGAVQQILWRLEHAPARREEHS